MGTPNSKNGEILMEIKEIEALCTKNGESLKEIKALGKENKALGTLNSKEIKALGTKIKALGKTVNTIEEHTALMVESRVTLPRQTEYGTR
jgi:hypothetical protein